MYDISQISEAASIDDAIAKLCEYPKAVLICGGSDVLIKIREGKLAGCSLVSIHNVSELKGVTMEADGTIIIKAATTFSHIANDPIVQKHLNMLSHAVELVGGPQVRNIGTIGGNICNGVTSADSASTLFTYNAVLKLRGPKGERLVPIQDFYVGPGKTIREHDEVLTEIRIAKEDYDGFYGCYIKYGKRNAMEIATLGCAANVKLMEDQQYIKELRLSFGVAAPVPIRCRLTEQVVSGMKISYELFEVISEQVFIEVNPRTSWRATKEFRLQLIKELSRRAVKHAIIYAGGDASAYIDSYEGE